MRDSHRKVAGPGRLLLRRSFVFACLASLLLGSQSKATASTEIINLSQVSGSNTVTLSNSGAGGNHAGTENLTSNGTVLVTISELNGATVSPPIQANLVLSASNIGTPATVSGTTVTERFSGTFSVKSLDGTFNFLSGSFTDTVSGTIGGTKLELGSTQPPLSLSFTSDVPGMPLSPPTALQFAFTNLSAPLTFTGTSGVDASIGPLGSIDMSVGMNASASTPGVPEPSSLLVAGICGLGLIGYGLRRRRILGV